MNSTLEEIPLAVSNAIRNGSFSVRESWRGNRCIIGREVSLNDNNDDTWSVIAVITMGKVDGVRLFHAYRYFLSQGLRKLPDILFWHTEIANEPVFDPFDRKEIGKPYLYDRSLTKIDNSILGEFIFLENTTKVIYSRGQEITQKEVIIYNRLISVINVHQLASQVSTNSKLVFWIICNVSSNDSYHNYLDSLFNYSHFYNCLTICLVTSSREKNFDSTKLFVFSIRDLPDIALSANFTELAPPTPKPDLPTNPPILDGTEIPTSYRQKGCEAEPSTPKLGSVLVSQIFRRMILKYYRIIGNDRSVISLFRSVISLISLSMRLISLSMILSSLSFLKKLFSPNSSVFSDKIIEFAPSPPHQPKFDLPSFPPIGVPPTPILGLPLLLFVIVLPLLSIGWLIQNNFGGVIQIILLTITICITPTITHLFTQKKSRIARSLLESFLFIGLLLGFSLWMFGLSSLGFWIIPSILLILVVEIGSNIIEIYKISTLEHLSKEITFENVKDKANEIEQLFKNEVAIYSSVPLGLLLGTIVGIIYHHSHFEMVVFSFKIVLIIASNILIYFLCISFERMSDSLFKESDISSPKLKKEQKGILGLFAKLYKLIVPSQDDSRQKDRDIELACIVSDLRKIYLYDAIHNGLLLIIVGIIIAQLYGINFINQKLLIIAFILALLFIFIVFNLLPYSIGQASLHNQILKKYKGKERIAMLEKLRRHSPLLPLQSFVSRFSDASNLSLREFLFNPEWNSNFKKMLDLMEKKVNETNRLLKKMADKPEKTTFDLRYSKISGGIAGENYTGDVIHNYAPDKNLAEAAAEIQQLLDQLSKTYPTGSTSEKIELASKAFEEIEKNKSLGQRIIIALKAGGSSALEQSLSHPAASFLINFIKSWQETKSSESDSDS
jgi:hypothetical protein